MQSESPRHAVMSPVAALIARLFLLRSKVEKASQSELSPDLQSDIIHDLDALDEKVKALQQRVDQHFS